MFLYLQIFYQGFCEAKIRATWGYPDSTPQIAENLVVTRRETAVPTENPSTTRCRDTIFSVYV